MKTIILRRYIDAGHGWVRAPIRLLQDLDLMTRISEYSYISPSGNHVYLEEDQDALTLLRALDDKHISYSLDDVRGSDRSHIRKYPRFQLVAQ